MGCKKDNGCVCDVVRAILDLQENIQDDCECPSSCFLEPLGAISPAARNQANTRVFVLKTKDGSPFHAFFKGDPDECGVSIFFRVEEVFDNCCATLRVLRPVGTSGTVPFTSGDGDCCIDLTAFCDVVEYLPTDDCITVDLSCFCAIQCIEDVNLDLC